MRVAFVVQRYGLEVVGGAEHLARAVAERLAARHQVAVLTTCALDHRTWANHYQPGVERLNGLAVHRFPTVCGRDPDFDRFIAGFYGRAHTPAEELDWLRRQGPWSPALLEYVGAQRGRYDAFVFYTYLYAPTVLGLPLVAERSVLVPTAHDEPAIYLDLYRQLFAQPRFIVFLTRAERRFVQAQFANASIPSTVAALGIEPAAEPSGGRFRARYGVPEDIVLYAGRIEAAKGCGELIDWFGRFRQGWERPLRLVMLGKVAMPLPQRRDMLCPGFVSEEDKADALAAATVVVAPSPYESLSIVALESWQAATPVLANGDCAVLADHCLASNAGLPYRGYAEFAECLRLLLADANLRQGLGANGRRYVERNYTWPVVEARYERALERATSDK